MAKPDKQAKDAKTNVMRLLDAAAVPYTALHYNTDDGMIDGVSVAAKIERPCECVFKTLVTQGASRALLVFVIPCHHELDLKKAARAAREKSIAMLPSRDLLKNTGYIHGGCSPLGMKKPLPTFIDESAQLLDTMVVSAGKIGSQVELTPQQLLQLSKANFADLCK